MDPTKIENEINQEQLQTIVQNNVLNHISNGNNTVNANNDQNNDTLVAKSIKNENIGTSAIDPLR